VVAGLAFSITIAIVFLSSVRRSSFGWLIIFFEYFYVLGLGVYPLALALGAIDVPSVYADFESRNGQVLPETYAHISFYASGALVGYFGSRLLRRRASNWIISFAGSNRINSYTWFYAVSGLSILFSGLYFGVVGFKNSLVNASFARSGDFTGLAGFEQYQFLKTLAMIGPFSMVFAPYIVIEGKRLKSSFCIIAIFAVSIYALTVARVVFFDTFVFFSMLLIVLGRSKVVGIILATTVSLFMILVLLFGKVFVGVLSAYLFADADFVFAAKSESISGYFFAHFAHLVYSIDAGIRNFQSNGPVIADDVLLSPLGFVPSFLYSAVGLDSLSYHLVDQSRWSSCINTTYFFTGGECSIPPYFTGVSAYVLPLVGGLLFGSLRFLVYGIIEGAWIKMRKNPELLWFPVVLLFVANQLMLFIPVTIAFAVFISMVLFASLFVRRLLIRALQRARRSSVSTSH
jgi:hypothetical protein